MTKPTPPRDPEVELDATNPSPSPHLRSRFRLAEAVAAPPVPSEPIRNPELEAFVQSEHFEPVLRALQNGLDFAQRRQEECLGSDSAVIFYAGAISGLRGTIEQLRKHVPKEKSHG